jgi:RimJ/RimL family protein N-acetyltransferase
MIIDVNERIHLTEFRSADKSALIAHLADREIYERTLRIPFPYTEAEADQWLAIATGENQRHVIAFAIRNTDGALIGSCGVEGWNGGTSHRAEIGYWLARTYWGQGVMTAVVRQVCAFAFADLGLRKLCAQVFANNPASARVLEKCGFECEGYLRCHYFKDGRYIDALTYGLLA